MMGIECDEHTLPGTASTHLLFCGALPQMVVGADCESKASGGKDKLIDRQRMSSGLNAVSLNLNLNLKRKRKKKKA